MITARSASSPVPIDRRTVSISTVARELGINRNLAYELARTDALPVPVIRIGQKRVVVSRAALDDLLASPSRARVPSNDDSPGFDRLVG